MLSIINQFKRIYSDNGEYDKSFYDQENRLKEAVTKLKSATDEVVRAAQRMSYALREGSSKLN